MKARKECSFSNHLIYKSSHYSDILLGGAMHCLFYVLVVTLYYLHYIYIYIYIYNIILKRRAVVIILKKWLGCVWTIYQTQLKTSIEGKFKPNLKWCWQYSSNVSQETMCSLGWEDTIVVVKVEKIVVVVAGVTLVDDGSVNTMMETAQNTAQ